MAIGKITRGNGFYGVMSYLLDEDKDPQILGGCMVGEKADDIAREFRQIANQRPDIQNPVRHFSISFAPEDGEVDDLVKETIAYRVLDGLGYEDCQFMAVGHRRDQPGHDEVHNHDHMHIVANAVTLEGKYVRDSFERYKIQEVLREVEKEFGLKQVKSSWEVNNERGKNQEVNRNSEIAELVANSLKDNPSLEAWLNKLATDEIDVRFNLSDKGTVKGIVFIKDGEAHKGSSIGVKWSRYKGTKNPSSLDGDCLIVGEIITIASEDIPLMEAANHKSRQHPVKLTQIDRAMFDRSVEMAEMTLEHQGRNNKWRNGRAEIVLNGDNLKVRRVRPEKLMFEAARVDGNWEPVGFPNIEKMDVQLLERINAVEGMDFPTSEGKTAAIRGKSPTERQETTLNLQVDAEEQLNVTEDDEFLQPMVKTTTVDRLQEAIDQAAEQATDSIAEFRIYLVNVGVQTEIEENDDGEATKISYEFEGSKFNDSELIDASLQALGTARGLSLEKNKASKRILNLLKIKNTNFYDDDLKIVSTKDNENIKVTTSLDDIIKELDINNLDRITFLDIVSYQNYLKSKEYKQQFSPEERIDLDKKANDTVNPIMNQFRSIAREAAGEFLPSPHPYFRSFETELELSEQDRQGIETARDWAERQPKAPVRDTEPRRDPER